MPPPDSTLEALQQILVVSSDNRALLAAILQELREQAQQGIATTITDSVTTRTVKKIEFAPSLFSISITCDGPASFEYRVPDRTAAPWVQINPGEVNTFNYTKARVDSIGLRTLPAGIASNFRILGSF